MLLKFTKMEGAGNDFIVVNAIDSPFRLNKEQIQKLANRHFGIGFDQLLVVEAAENRKADFRYRIFNADGFEVSQCGNGARCFVKYVHEKNLSHKKTITIETRSGLITPTLQDGGDVIVDMGMPRFSPPEIPLVMQAQQSTYSLLVDGETVVFSAVSMGNPHAVIRVDNVDKAPVVELGPVLEIHEVFPERVNVGFMEIISKDEIKLRVWERGAGETLACGTGACAAAVTGILSGSLNPKVRIQTHGGALSVCWEGPGKSVLLSGPAVSVFEGEILVND
jgi:diaminopimelate epimerase